MWKTKKWPVKAANAKKVCKQNSPYAYSICRQHIYKRKPFKQNKAYLLYNIKGHLFSLQKTVFFRRQKVTFFGMQKTTFHLIYICPPDNRAYAMTSGRGTDQPSGRLH